MKSPLIKRSILVAGRQTEVSLEGEFWHALKDIAAERRLTLPGLVTEIAAGRPRRNLSSTVRLFVLSFYRDQISELERRSQTRAMLASAKTARPRQAH
jgi:predicted DNA-binding ribbon-helix-helix protein